MFQKYIYTICGKGANQEVLDACDKYDIEADAWLPMASTNRKRYAASATVAAEIEKIFLIGGRSEANNAMIEDIEEYSIRNDRWAVVKLRSEFVPVEVCTSVQISMGKILIFGGSNAQNNDSHNSYLFKYEENKIEKIATLQKSHVFVSNPFLHGGHVYAIGNEYYIKSRNIHRFDINAMQWDIIF